MEYIKQFTKKYGFLSNFYSVDITVENITYPSVEHAYQAMKTVYRADREVISLAKTPYEAKKLGRRIQLRENWDGIRLGVMSFLLWQKYNNYEDLEYRLIDTNPKIIVEGNNWGDRFWGVDLKTNKGLNWLGRQLMVIRSQLIWQNGGY